MGSSLVGSTIGRFRVDRLLGKGGMGEVYSAFDSTLERQVALKVLVEDEAAVVEGTADVQRMRLLREARLAARLTHPNIATVHEVDELNGHVYVVMELLEGISLRSLLLRRRIAIDEAISIARDMARALAKAHGQGVIHRDVKPENVFLTQPSPDSISAKVLDFGLARQRPGIPGNANDEQTSMFKPGDMQGTPGYVSPEQAAGQVVDVRTDIFSFGVVLYEMLAGMKPFQADNSVALLLVTARQEARPLREIVPELAPEIEDIVRCCMAKDREHRFPDGGSLSAALENYVRMTPSGMMANVVGSTPSMPGLSAEMAARAYMSTGTTAAIEMGSAAPPPDQQRQERLRLWVAIGCGLTVALFVIVLGLSLSRRASHSVATSGPPVDPNAPVAVPTLVSVPGEAPVKPVVVLNAPTTGIPLGTPTGTPVMTTPTGVSLTPDVPDASASAAAPAVAKLAAKPAAVPAPGPAPVARKPPSSSGGGAADCKNPFTTDAKGVKIPKPQCL